MRRSPPIPRVALAVLTRHESKIAVIAIDPGDRKPITAVVLINVDTLPAEAGRFKA